MNNSYHHLTNGYNNSQKPTNECIGTDGDKNNNNRYNNSSSRSLPANDDDLRMLLMGSREDSSNDLSKSKKRGSFRRSVSFDKDCQGPVEADIDDDNMPEQPRSPFQDIRSVDLKNPRSCYGIVAVVVAGILFLLLESEWSVVDEPVTQGILSSGRKHQPTSEFDIQLETPPCKDVPSMIQNAEKHYKVNELRRRLLLGDPNCLEEHYTLFEEEYKQHIQTKERRVVNLDIAETGGSSLCDMAKRSGKVAPETSPEKANRKCFIFPFRPVWGAGTFPPTRSRDEPEPGTCDQLVNRYADQDTLIANGQYFRHPFCTSARKGRVVFDYSITIREPVDRAVSHVNSLLNKAQNTKQVIYFEDTTAFARRLNWVQSNYMTWSLMAGLTADPYYMVPRTVLQLEQALSTLYKFDFLFNPTSESWCAELLLNKLGLMDPRSAQLPDATNVTEAELEREAAVNPDMYVRSNYAAINEMDKIIYARALEIMEHDCNFYHDVFQA